MIAKRKSHGVKVMIEMWKSEGSFVAHVPGIRTSFQAM